MIKRFSKSFPKIYTAGFTLIELLVVIAIIGILSSVVLASLNSARAKGADVAVKSNLNNMRAQSELIYDTQGDYSTVCANAQITAGTLSAGTAGGVSPYVSAVDAVQTVNTAVCHDDATGWAVQAPLKSGGNWC